MRSTRARIGWCHCLFVLAIQSILAGCYPMTRYKPDWELGNLWSFGNLEAKGADSCSTLPCLSNDIHLIDYRVLRRDLEWDSRIAGPM
jgi:hypothetical protein